MMIEWFYNFTIGANLPLLVLLCVTFPKKVKYDSNGEPKHTDGHIFRCALTAISLLWYSFLSFIVFFGVLDRLGSMDKKYFIQVDDKWLPAFFVMTVLYGYHIYKLVHWDRKLNRRRSILTFIKYYPSPKITLQQAHTFCKDNDLVIFPILLFQIYLEKCQDEQGDMNGIAFEKMVNEMTKFKEFEKMKVKSCDADSNNLTLDYCTHLPDSSIEKKKKKQKK